MPSPTAQTIRAMKLPVARAFTGLSTAFLARFISTAPTLAGALAFAAAPSSTKLVGKAKLARTAQTLASKVPTIYKIMIFLSPVELVEVKCFVAIDSQISTKTTIGAIAFKAPTNKLPSSSKITARLSI